MNFEGKSIYGNEWLVPTQEYYKFNIGTDGIYKITLDDLRKADLPIQNITLDKIRLYHLGQEVEIRTSTNGLMGKDDFIEFFAVRNRGELDAPLFKKASFVFNEDYSIYSDTSAYFITWNATPSTFRYQEIQNDLTNPIPKDNYFIREITTSFKEVTIKRSFGYGHSQKLPDFDEGQGYGTDYFVERAWDLMLENVYKNDIDANINVAITGYGEDASAHKAAFYLNNNLLKTDPFSGYKVRKNAITIAAADLSSQMNLKIKAEGNIEDKLSVSVIKYSYPSEFKFNQSKYAQIKIPSSIIRKYLEIENFDGGPELLIYDLTNKLFIKSSRENNGIYRISIPESTSDRTLILLNPSEVKSVNNIKKSFIENYVSDGTIDFIILTSSQLLNGTLGNNQVQDYASYRSSSAGGNHKVKIVEVENIYNAFGFGIQGHAISLRNFFQYTRTIWPNVKYAFIIGKGLEYPVYRQNSNLSELNFVPTYGAPASDAMLISDSLRIPFYAIGRLPVINGQEILDYVNKVKEHEAYLATKEHTIENKEWMKRVLHLAGGDPALYSIINSQLFNMEDVIENNLYGSKVETFYKQTSGAVEESKSEQLINLINNGVSIITFMGHSVAFKLDFNLESIYSYNNKGRYHMFVAMGCYAGQMYNSIRSISEVHNLTPDRGSIIYLSNSTAGLPTILSTFGGELYRQLGGKYYGLSVGEAVRESNRNLISDANKNLANLTNEAILHQSLSTSFDGDPSIRLNNNPGQDIVADPLTAKASPNPLFSSQKEFKFSVDILNLGVSYKDSVRVLVRNQGPDGKLTTVFNGSILTPTLRSNYTFTIPLFGQSSVGFNTLFVTVDSDDKIDELPSPQAEKNNDLVFANGENGFKYYVIGNDAIPVYPTEFAIITKDKIQLIASNGNTFAKSSNYYFEIDTTAYFNSSLKRTKSVNQVGGVISWNIDQSLLPNTVYYWRIRPDSSGSGIIAWKNSSFIYIPSSSTGWNQSHFFQHTQNDFTKMNISEPDRKFKYNDEVVDFRVYNGYIEIPGIFIRPKIFINSQVEVDYDYWNRMTDVSGILVSVFDALDGHLWINQTGSDFNSSGNGTFVGQKYFLFRTETKDQRQQLINFLTNVVPTNSVVTISSLVQLDYSFYPELWESDGPNNLYTVLKGFGAKEIESLKTFGSIPYLMVFKKENAQFEVKESLGNKFTEIEIGHHLNISQTNGSVQSRIIGPAISYDKFLWNYKGFNGNEDKQEINIYGIDSKGIETKLFGPFVDLEKDLRGVDAKLYPQLKLEWKTEDEISRTSPSNDFWRVHYKGLPDVALNPAQWFTKSKDTLNQGNILRVEILAQNVSEYDMDSLLVKFSVVDSKNATVNTYRRFIPVKALASIKIPFDISTTRQVGAYKLFVELNPDQDQAELYSFNNIGVIDYYVRKDIRRPKLTVVFNGVQITDGEIISPESNIEIALRDENIGQPLVDTGLFTIKFEYPDRSVHPVYLGASNVSFIPANVNGTKNEAKVIISNDFTLDGTYRLIVRAKDATNNSISDDDYNISFQVISKSGASNVFNYPNPFTTKTKFVYTLTGRNVPDYYKIQILSVSGRVVRELTQDEIGPLKIGTHMTEFEYDGTDEFGAKLANGVYLYRMVFKNKSGEEVSKYDTDTDKFFKNNLGKMVIIR